MKFCQFIANLYPHIFTSFCWFILIFSKMASFVLGVLIVFTMSSLEFHQVKLLWFHCRWWVAPMHPTSVHWIIRFGAMLEFYYKLQLKPKQFSSLKVHFSGFGLPYIVNQSINKFISCHSTEAHATVRLCRIKEKCLEMDLKCVNGWSSSTVQWKRVPKAFNVNGFLQKLAINCALKDYCKWLHDVSANSGHI